MMFSALNTAGGSAMTRHQTREDLTVQRSARIPAVASIYRHSVESRRNTG